MSSPLILIFITTVESQKENGNIQKVTLYATASAATALESQKENGNLCEERSAHAAL